jgi:hypothetical protein
MIHLGTELASYKNLYQEVAAQTMKASGIAGCLNDTI